MWVVNEGQREPARRSSCSTASTSSAIVTPGTTSGAVAAMVFSTVTIARPIASSSSPLLIRRSSLTSREPVRSRSAPRIRAELQRRLGPHAVADRDRTGARGIAGDALEDRRAVIGLVHDDQLALRRLAHVEGGEHARHDEDRLAPR